MAKTKFGDITIGADPELFLVQDRNIIPAVGKIGGTKDHPLAIPGLGEGFGMQEDNVMVEFNIPPANGAMEFSNNLMMAIGHIKQVIPHGTDLVAKSSHLFKARQLRSKQAKVFGCEPDQNAWTGRENRFIPATDPRLRSCGGHVHIGLPDNVRNIDTDRGVIRACDVFLGVPSILLDNDTRRREIYGKAGAFRFKAYGVEYRTLSNFWLESAQLREWVFDSAIRAVETVANGGLPEINEWGPKIVEAINKQDKKLAEIICNKFDVELV